MPCSRHGGGHVRLRLPGIRSAAVNAVEKSLAGATKHTDRAARAGESSALDDAPDEAAKTGRWLLRRVAAVLGDPPIEFAIRAGARVRSVAAPIGRVVFASRAHLASMLADPWVRFGDGYSDSTLSVEGDLVAVLEAVYRASTMGDKPSWL